MCFEEIELLVCNLINHSGLIDNPPIAEDVHDHLWMKKERIFTSENAQDIIHISSKKHEKILTTASIWIC